MKRKEPLMEKKANNPMSFSLLLLFVGLVTRSAVGADGQDADPPLFTVTVDGRSGFIDANGKVVIPPTFEKAYSFRDGLAAVMVGGRWGFIDAKGRQVIDPQFAEVGFFSEGLASFRKTPAGKWGYINASGEVLLEPRFDSAGEFRNGVAQVAFETARGRALALIADAQLVPPNVRFIDRTGEFVADPGPTRLATGAAGELIPFTKNGMMGYVDAAGTVVIAPTFAEAHPFSDGLACARTGNLYGYIDKSGKFVIPPRFRYASEFHEGMAGVPLGERGWGFIDRAGKEVIPPKFGWVYGGFRHGIAEVSFDGMSGYINKHGEWVWPPAKSEMQNRVQ
jgi:hypothetical protein